MASKEDPTLLSLRTQLDQIQNTPSAPVLSERSSVSLISLLASKGYLHTHDSTTLSKESSTEIVHCSSSEDRSIITFSHLLNELQRELISSGGRLKLSSASNSLSVDISHITRAATTLASQNRDTITFLKDDLISEEYLQSTFDEILDELETTEGKISISELSVDLGLPFELLSSKWKERGGTVSANEREFVTDEYERSRFAEVRGALAGISIPTNVDDLMKEYKWDDATAVMSCISKCLTERPWMGGLFRGDEVYVPNVFLDRQRRGIDEFFKSNGYITEKQCAALGFGVLGRLKDYVQDSFPDAIPLQGTFQCLIDPSQILPPMEAAILEAETNRSFSDLSQSIPDPLLENANSIVSLLQPKDNQGLFLSGEDGALYYFSDPMTEDIRNLIPELVEPFARSKANEMLSQLEQQEKMKTLRQKEDILSSQSSSSKKLKKKKGSSKFSPEDDHDEEPPLPKKKLSAREKRRKNKGSASAQPPPDTTSPSSSLPASETILPLSSFTSKLRSIYPDLEHLTYTLPEHWEDESSTTNPLHQYLLLSFHSRIHELCIESVKAEYDKLIQTRRTTGVVVSNKDNLRKITQAFEDASCWNQLCFAIQLFSKWWRGSSSCSFSSSGAATTTTTNAAVLLEEEGHKKELMEKEFLETFGAEFAKRVTMYCLFQKNVEDGMFAFGDKTGEEDDNDLPSFCRPFDVGVRKLRHKVYFQCRQKDEKKDTLQLLRDELSSGGVGVQLARMWILIGGECYDGGTKVSESGEVLVRKGDLNGFLKHVEESCLSMVGLPFKILDKKPEKQVMFARRQELQCQLESATTARDVWELTVMLLFQQVKHFAIAGEFILQMAWDQLSKEEKIPPIVIEKIRLLFDSIEDDETTIDDDLIEFVKKCGLCRDITKFQVTREEE